jgi:hypothetical protein
MTLEVTIYCSLYIINADILPVTLPNAVTSIDITDISFAATLSDTATTDPGSDCLPQIECFFEDVEGFSHRFTAKSGFVSPTNGVVPLLTIECGILPP